MTTTTAPAASLADAFAHAERLLETDPRLAAEQARAILEVVPRHADTTRLLAAALRLSGDAEGGLATIAPLAQALPNLPLAQLELPCVWSVWAAPPRPRAPLTAPARWSLACRKLGAACPRVWSFWAIARALNARWPVSSAPRPMTRC
jgi:hypothetical protein